MGDILKWNDNQTITVKVPKKCKKITGTRFAAIMGLNKWTTAFNAWCAITRTYEEPFEETIYTAAGKAIEPKQAEWARDNYFWNKLVTPTDVFGEDYFHKTYGDFFPESKHLGGMWDYLFVDDNGKPTTVLEMKTTKRIEDWKVDIPEYYAMQAALYAYLLGVDDVIMVCTVLEDKDYKNPDKFQVTSNNTFTRNFKVSERYPNFTRIVEAVEEWWDKHVKNGISPVYDEKADADILKALRSKSYSPDTDMDALITEAEDLRERLDVAYEELKPLEDRLNILQKMIKECASQQFRDGDKQVVIHGNIYDWVTSKSTSLKIDENAMKQNGILDKYKTKEAVSYRITAKKVGE